MTISHVSFISKVFSLSAETVVTNNLNINVLKVDLGPKNK